MRIVEYGHIKPKEIKCNYCGAILEYTFCDLKYWTDDACYLKCPVCHGAILKDNDGKYLTRRDTND